MKLTFVDASRDVSGGSTETHPEHDGAGHESAAVGGREEAETGEHWKKALHYSRREADNSASQDALHSTHRA